MFRFICNTLLVAMILLPYGSSSLQAAECEKQSLFNGRDLDGWTGNSDLWSVRDGQIVGTTVGHHLEANTFLIWQGGEFEDFHLTFKVRVEGENNSGVQYRSQVTDPKTWRVTGYQVDVHPKPEYAGMLYAEGTGRGIVAERGEKVVAGKELVKSKLEGQTFPVPPIDITKWHEYTIIAQGNHLVHKIDGKVTVDITDNHEKKCERGIFALQVHRGPAMTAFFKDIYVETLSEVKGSGNKGSGNKAATAKELISQ